MCKYWQCYVSLASLVLALVATIVAINLTMSVTSPPIDLYLWEHKQLLDDWTTQPFVELTMESSIDGCP